LPSPFSAALSGVLSLGRFSSFSVLFSSFLSPFLSFLSFDFFLSLELFLLPFRSFSSSSLSDEEEDEPEELLLSDDSSLFLLLLLLFFFSSSFLLEEEDLGFFESSAAPSLVPESVVCDEGRCQSREITAATKPS